MSILQIRKITNFSFRQGSIEYPSIVNGTIINAITFLRVCSHSMIVDAVKLFGNNIKDKRNHVEFLVEQDSSLAIGV